MQCSGDFKTPTTAESNICADAKTDKFILKLESGLPDKVGIFLSNSATSDLVISAAT